MGFSYQQKNAAEEARQREYKAHYTKGHIFWTNCHREDLESAKRRYSDLGVNYFIEKKAFYEKEGKAVSLEGSVTIFVTKKGKRRLVADDVENIKRIQNRPDQRRRPTKVDAYNDFVGTRV